MLNNAKEKAVYGRIEVFTKQFTKHRFTMHSTVIRTACGKSVFVETDIKVSAFGGLMAAVHHLRTCGVLGKVYDALLGTLPDRGQQGKVKHSAKDLLTQRLMGLMVGKEDLCDTDQLAADPGFMLAIGRDRLASTATLSRFEQKVGQATLDAGNELLLDMYFRFGNLSKYVYIDVDNTPVELHGYQENVKFNGHYMCNCYLPLLAFINGFPVGVYNGNEDGRATVVAHLREIVARIRRHRPDAIIVLRADSGFNGTTLVDLCEELGCYYLIGLSPNKALLRRLEAWDPQFMEIVRRPPVLGGTLLRHIGEIDDYQASSWTGPRRVIVRDYYDDERRQWDARFIQTNIPNKSDEKCGKLWRLTARELYENVYCDRGSAEKSNQEFKKQAFGARSSSTRFLTNSYRMLLAAICMLFYKILRTCFFTKAMSWYTATLKTFREHFVVTPAVVEAKRSRITLRMNLCRCTPTDIQRFWRTKLE